MTPADAADVGGLALMDDKESTSLRLKLRRIARTPIRSVPPDVVVKIRGRLLLRGAVLAAPVTGTPCVLYCVDAVDGKAEGKADGKVDGKAGGKPTRLPREIRGLDLILDDGTAGALVRVAGAQLSLLGNWMTSLATTRAEFLISRGRPPPHPLADPNHARYLEYRELKIVPGELVTVFGRADHGADPDPPRHGKSGERSGGERSGAYRVPRHRCVFIATPATPLYIIQERVVALDAVG